MAVGSSRDRLHRDRRRRDDTPPRLRLDTDPLSAPVPPVFGEKQQRVALIVVAVLAFLAAAWIASALWAGLLVGLLTAFAMERPHRYVKRHFPNSPVLAAAASTTGVWLVVLGAVAGLGAVIGSELVSAAGSARVGGAHFSMSSLLGPTLAHKLASYGIGRDTIDAQIGRLADRATSLASELASAALGSALAWAIGTFVAIVTTFYVLKDRRPIERRLQEVLPLHPRTTKELVDEFRLVGRGTLVGSVLTAMVQGALAGIGFAIAGIPRAPLFGAVTAVAAFVPVIGTICVWIPAGIYLLATGATGAGIFDLVWGALVVVALSDYVIRPLIVGRESHSHPLLFLVGFIGGVEVLGGVGVIAGPIILAFFASVLRIYRREIVGASNHHNVLEGYDPRPANDAHPSEGHADPGAL